MTELIFSILPKILSIRCGVSTSIKFLNISIRKSTERKIWRFLHLNKSEGCCGLTPWPLSAPEKCTKKSSIQADSKKQLNNLWSTTTTLQINLWTSCSSHSLLNICWSSLVSSNNPQEMLVWLVLEAQEGRVWQGWPLLCASMKYSKFKSQKPMERLNGSKISRRFLHNLAAKTNPPFSYSLTVKSKINLSLKMSTIYSTPMKYPICSQPNKKQK